MQLQVLIHQKPKNFFEKNNVNMFNSSGNGYVEDLNQILKIINEPTFVTSGDLPFLDGKIIQNIVKQYNPEKIWTSILVTQIISEIIKNIYRI